MPYRECSGYFLNTNDSSSVFLGSSSGLIGCKVLGIKSHILQFGKDTDDQPTNDNYDEMFS